MVTIYGLNGVALGEVYLGNDAPWIHGGVGAEAHPETGAYLRKLLLSPETPPVLWWLGLDGTVQASGVTVARWGTTLTIGHRAGERVGYSPPDRSSVVGSEQGE